jgi:nucleoid-associated protein YgaU
VIAGRAAPGAEVTVLDRGQPVGHATANANGEWVVLTDRPLPPGPQELSLSARAAGETAARTSTSTLAVVVPPHGAAEAPVAVLLPQGEGAARPLGLGGNTAPHHFALDMVEYDAKGRTILTGRADPGAAVDVFIDGRLALTVHAGVDGNWTATLDTGVPAGRYKLRLVAHEGDGAAAGELAFDMRRAAPGEFAGRGYLAVVPGNSLWVLAQRSYGEGLRYVEIYQANRSQIGDPDLIYPGQLLALPEKQ